MVFELNRAVIIYPCTWKGGWLVKWRRLKEQFELTVFVASKLRVQIPRLVNGTEWGENTNYPIRKSSLSDIIVAQQQDLVPLAPRKIRGKLAHSEIKGPGRNGQRGLKARVFRWWSGIYLLQSMPLGRRPSQTALVLNVQPRGNRWIHETVVGVRYYTIQNGKSIQQTIELVLSFKNPKWREPIGQRRCSECAKGFHQTPNVCRSIKGWDPIEWTTPTHLYSLANGIGCWWNRTWNRVRPFVRHVSNLTPCAALTLKRTYHVATNGK